MGFVKVIWGAIVDKVKQRMGIGIIVINHEGSVLAAMSASQPSVMLKVFLVFF